MKEKIFKTDSETAVEKLEKKLASFQEHPLLKKIEEDYKAANFERRQIAAAKIQELTKERDSVLPKLKAAFDEKEEAYRTAKTAFETSENELRQAKIFLSNKSNFFEHSIGKQKDILIESADSQIDSAIEFFQKKLEWLRSPERISHGKAGAKRNVFSMEKTVKQESNLPAVNRALQYCQESIQELEAMKLIPSIDTGKIEEMKKAIPDISIFEIFEGSKPLEKSGNPLDSLLSDSHLDYVKGKVLEKVERTLNPKKKASARR